MIGIEMSSVRRTHKPKGFHAMVLTVVRLSVDLDRLQGMTEPG